MAVFGYLVFVIICLMVTILAVLSIVASRMFDDASGLGRLMLPFMLVLCCCLWWGAYVLFPFEVIVK